ncbi:hypothetical protein CAPTEDRAFT_196313 [Capitella teleta]|uniref:BTB domain-containing protein n=1 Tax=Capitella teleta TaxID=283909 RepID=R7TA44_CAPTE|nr:hypothetical protein CAPTEDRAFT_196313 [Capitella teleta]|eukprot:ELT87884.1 hypothetical protein CAPTEDRAFT_196313 [Capitella teleta]
MSTFKLRNSDNDNDVLFKDRCQARRAFLNVKQSMKDSLIAFFVLSESMDCVNEIGIPCDVELKTNDGGCFPVHRIFMVGQSPFFRAIFTNGCEESKQHEVQIGVVSERGLSNVIKYTYTRMLDVHDVMDTNHLGEIHFAADFLLVEGLRNVCELLLAMSPRQRTRTAKEFFMNTE